MSVGARYEGAAAVPPCERACPCAPDPFGRPTNPRRGSASRGRRCASAPARIFVLALAAAAATAESAAAQRIDVPPVDPLGHRARVHFCDGRPMLLGTLTSLDSARLSLLDFDAARTIPLADVRRLEIRRQDRGKWATIGLFAGIGAGILATTVAAEDGDYYRGLIGLFVVSPIAGLIGAPIGAILAPEQWERVRPAADARTDLAGCPPERWP
jgi:hypothetical protein